MLGIPQPSLSAYESGKNKPTIANVILIADKCNVSVDWLCGRDKHNYLNSMGDLVGFLFDLYDANELTFKTGTQNRIDREHPEDGDSGRNLVRLTFYYGDILRDGKPLFSADGLSFRPPPIRQIPSLLHRDIITNHPHRDFTKQSASP